MLIVYHGHTVETHAVRLQAVEQLKIDNRNFVIRYINFAILSKMQKLNIGRGEIWWNENTNQLTFGLDLPNPASPVSAARSDDPRLLQHGQVCHAVEMTEHRVKTRRLLHVPHLGIFFMGECNNFLLQRKYHKKVVQVFSFRDFRLCLFVVSNTALKLLNET